MKIMLAQDAYHLGMAFKRHAAAVRSTLTFFGAVLSTDHKDGLRKMAEEYDRLKAEMIKIITKDDADRAQHDIYVAVLNEEDK